MKKFIFPAFLFLTAVTSGSAQTTGEDYYGAPSKPKLVSKDRISASIMAGTSVSFLSNSKTTAFTTFVAPKINYRLTEKFRLNVGFMHYTATPNTVFFLNNNEALINNKNRNISGNLVMLGGDYKLNKKVTLSGAVMMDANSLNKNNQQNNYKAASFGIDYKVSEHSSIGIRTTVSQGGNEFFYSPAGGPFQYSHPLNAGFGGFGEIGGDAFNSFTR